MEMGVEKKKERNSNPYGYKSRLQLQNGKCELER